MKIEKKDSKAIYDSRRRLQRVDSETLEDTQGGLWGGFRGGDAVAVSPTGVSLFDKTSGFG